MKLMLRVVAIGLALASVGSAKVWQVSIVDFAFSPATINVAQGDTVVWTNNGTFSHSSTSGTNGIPDGIWDSGLLSHGASYSRVFANVGSFPYFCSLHHGMTGVVDVGPAAGLDDERQVIVPSSLMLAVSPNPFHVSATTRYRPQGSNPVSIEILDLNGRVVRSVKPGANSALWDGADQDGLPAQAGVYIVRLSQGENVNYARLVKPQ
jgi:plastocyanin